MPEDKEFFVAGVDGCKSGWIAVIRNLKRPQEIERKLFKHFSEILDHQPYLSVIAVDMPIGLPDFIDAVGRGPEKAARKHLGERQSSVFSVPARAAVYEQDYWVACERAFEASDPPRKVSKQCFYLFPKIREIDALMSEEVEKRVFEVHPELAFWRLNGEAPMSLPKKIKSRPNPAGLDQRQQLLTRHGIAQSLFDQEILKGCGRDDLLDAAANSLIAERIHDGVAEPFPQDFIRDARGLRMAIWA